MTTWSNRGSFGMIGAVLVAIPLIASGFRAPADSPSPATQTCSVAVLNFETRDKALEDKAAQLGRLLPGDLAQRDGLIVVEREELQKVLSEQELGLSGTIDAATAAKTGRLTGAKVLVSGSVFREGDDTVVIARMVSTETSRMFTETVRVAQGVAATEIARQLGEMVSASVSANLDAILAETESRDEFISRLKGMVAGKPLPVVTVSITETHNRGAAVDPAAQTEISSLLKAIGFGLVEPQEAGRAQIEIVGEAVSEFGVRRGNLTFCRGRVEIKARKRGQGTILAVDSQTEGAMDLGEHIAGKTAIQKAAARWLERNIDKLVSD